MFDTNQYIDLNSATKLIIKVNSEIFSCFFINEGDILVVDMVAKISDGMRVLVSFNGELSIRIFRTIAHIDYIQTTDNKFLPLSIKPYVEYKIIGVISSVIHKVSLKS